MPSSVVNNNNNKTKIYKAQQHGYSHYKGAVQCSLLVGLFWKQLVSAVGTWEKMCPEHVCESP